MSTPEDTTSTDPEYESNSGGGAFGDYGTGECADTASDSGVTAEIRMNADPGLAPIAAQERDASAAEETTSTEGSGG